MANKKATFPTYIIDNFEDKYILQQKDPKIGGMGIVYFASRDKDPQNVVAIKFYVPSEFDFFQSRPTFMNIIDTLDEKIFNIELEFLKKFRHPGLQELISYGKIEEDNFYAFAKLHPAAGTFFSKTKKIHFLISKYIDAFTIDEWLKFLDIKILDKKLSKSEARDLLIRAIIETAEVLNYIHEVCQYLHSDISAENILIQKSSNRPVLIDFGNARCFNLRQFQENKKTSIRAVTTNFPSELVEELNKLKKDHSFTVEREELKKLMFPWLDLYNYGEFLRSIIHNEISIQILTAFDIEFIDSLVQKLTDWKRVKTSQTSEYFNQIKKLSHGYWFLGKLQYSPQSTGQIRHIALPNHLVPINNLVDRIIQTRAFRRLEKINQLSLLHLVYPGATQNRFEHSLAVYNTAYDLLNYLINSPRFCLLFDSKSIQKLLIFSLLHDINHFPFLHYFQELKLMKPESNILDIFCNGKFTQDDPSIYNLIGEVDISSLQLQDVLFRKIRYFRDPTMQVIKSIIDSGVDIDKISYVIDDSRNTGVPFGSGVDRKTLLSEADIALLKDNDITKPYYHFCFKPDALSAVENLLFTRYWNFKQIYWHHANRAIEAMITYVVKKIFVDSKTDFEQYVIRTIGMSEVEALRFLNELFKNIYNKDSIIQELFINKRVLYKRLYSIKRSFKKFGQTEDSFFDEILNLDEEKLASFMNNLIDGLNNTFASQLSGDILSEEDVLIDIPGRELHKEIGDVHIFQIACDGTPEYTINSPFIDQLNNEFLNLSQTIRLFISPFYREKIGKIKIESSKDQIRDIISDSLKTSGPLNMIK